MSTRKRNVPIKVIFLTLILQFAICTLSTRSDAQGRGTPRVAIFFQPGFPTLGPGEMVSPKAIAEALRKTGLRCETLDLETLRSSAKFNAGLYDAVILPYGNAYPQVAFPNLRSFHKAGGCLIMSGIPFTHPIVSTHDSNWNYTWLDRGHDDTAARFDSQGIGVGGFNSTRISGFSYYPNDPWQLASISVDWRGQAQTMNTLNLPSSVEVRPALSVQGRMAAGLVIHRRGEFAGAVDAWTNYPNPSDLIQDAYSSEQLMERGTVAALATKGLLTPVQEKRAFGVLNSLDKPVIYANITLPTPPRPYPTLQPKRGKPAEHLTVADVRKLSKAEQLLLASLQGIVNREEPRIFLIWNEDSRFCLNTMIEQGRTGKPVETDDPFSLLEIYKASYQGVVVSDPKVYVTPCIALDYAGLEDLLIATPGLAKKWKLPIKVDLRRRFKDNAEALRFARQSLLPRMNPYLSLCIDPPLLGSQVDDVISARGMAFWVTGPLAQGKPGANERAEYEEVEATFANTPLGGIVRGYWWNGDGMGLGEYPGVRLGSRFGKITTVSDYVGNYSVTSGVSLSELKQKPQPPAPKLDRAKVYIAITMSDGDNLCTFNKFWRDYFNDPLHGTFPLGFGMGPTLLDLSPPLAQWYYEHAAPTDEFICDVSGVGYISPTDWGRALRDEPATFRQFYKWTQDYMRRLDMKTIRINDVGPEQIARVGANLPETKFLMPDYGYVGENSYSNLTYSLPTGQSVFRAVTYGPKAVDLEREIRSRVGKSRPAFLNVFVFNWGSSLAELKKTLDRLGPEYVPVTPSQLDALYRGAK